MRLIITFLGKLNPAAKPTPYAFGPGVHHGTVFAEALRQFCPHDRMLVCVTPTARQTAYPVLTALNDPRIEPVDIPDGQTTAEMWDTFRRVTAQVNEGDEVIFDITHGLRSLPFLVFLFAAYLKAAKRVQIVAVYYGALELRPLNGSVPVIDLSEFVMMLDWLSATDRFVQSGAGNTLADLIQQRMPPSSSMALDLEQRAWGNQLKHLSATIQDTSQALVMTRPIGSMQAAAKLDDALTNAATAMHELAPPLTVLASEIRATYSPFGLTDLTQLNGQTLMIERQCRMLNWYVAKQQYVQAAILARELVISIVLVYFSTPQGTTDMIDTLARENVEKALNNWTERVKPNRREVFPSTISSDQMKAIDESGTLRSNWNKLADLRNDVAHCGMRPNARQAKKLIKELKEIADDVTHLADRLHLPPWPWVILTIGAPACRRLLKRP